MSQYFASVFRRRPNEGWFRAGNLSVTTVDVVCAVAVFTMFVYGILGARRWEELAFSPFPVRNDYDVWRLVTWSTATQPNFWPLLSIVFFWSWGQDIEAMLGRNRFLGWFLTVTILPAVVLTVLGGLSDTIDRTTFAAGIGTIFLAAIWVYAATYPKVKFFDAIPIWAVAVVFTLIDLLSYNGQQIRGMVVFTLVAIAVALSTARSLGAATGWEIPHIPLPGLARKKASGPVRSAKGKVRGRKSPKVVDGPWAGAPAPPPPPRPAGRDAVEAQAELDALLDKISAGGLDALSADEKRRLNELSKRLR